MTIVWAVGVFFVGWVAGVVTHAYGDREGWFK